jgi:hypothetical protein
MGDLAMSRTMTRAQEAYRDLKNLADSDNVPKEFKQWLTYLASDYQPNDMPYLKIKEIKQNWKAGDYSVTFQLDGYKSVGREKPIRIKDEIELFYIGGRWRNNGLISDKDVIQILGVNKAYLQNLESFMEAAYWYIQEKENKLEKDKEREEIYYRERYERIINEYSFGRHEKLAEWREANQHLKAMDIPKQLKDVKHLKEHSLADEHPCYVYFLVQDDEVVYVGKTTQPIPVRPLSHDDKEFNRIFYTECDSRSLSDVETSWIKKLQPKYNIAGTDKQ